MRKTLSKTEEQTANRNQTNGVCQIDCENREKQYIGQMGTKWIHEHRLAKERHDVFSLITIHEDDERYELSFGNVKVIVYARTKHSKEFLEA